MEKRIHERIPNEKLVGALQGFIVHDLKDDGVKARTLDASIKGLGLIIQAAEEDFIFGYNVIIESETDSSLKLIGRVIYASQMKDDHYKVGIQLMSSRSYDRYTGMLKPRD